MLELDAWLAEFLDSGYAGLDAAQRSCFRRLLEEDDLLLFDWLNGQALPPPDYADLVTRIRRPDKSPS